MTLHHDLTITKLEAYGFPHNSLQYIRSYLPNRQPRVRVNSSFNTCENTIAGVSLGSILRLLLFNVFINDLFLFVSNSHLINYADDNTITTEESNEIKIKNILRFGFDLISKWFEKNYMFLRVDKSYFICFGKNAENEKFIFNNFIFNNSYEEKILGTTIDYGLLYHLNNSKKRLIFSSIKKS